MELLVLLLYSFNMCPMLLYVYVWYKAFCKTIWFSNQMQLGFRLFAFLAGFMLFKSLMREREVVVGGWLVIIGGGGKHILTL